MVLQKMLVIARIHAYFAYACGGLGGLVVVAMTRVEWSIHVASNSHLG